MRRRLQLICWICLGLGVLGLLLGLFFDTTRFFFSYLTAWAFYLSTCIGALMLLMIGHAGKVRWFAGLRRQAEYPTALLPLFAVLAVPLFFGLPELYAWARPLESLPEGMRPYIEHKAAWMNIPFFIIRTLIWIGILSFFAVLLVSGSLRLDRAYDEALKLRLRRISSVGLLVCSFVLTWASFDWLMSLDATWYSTIFGVYVFAGGIIAALAVLTILGVLFLRAGLLPSEIASEHYWAVGRLMLGFVIFWAYQGFSQLIIIWLGNMPHEITFYQSRGNRGWGWVTFALVMGQFALPFLVLLSRDLKRNPVALAWISVWMLLVHWVDMYWLVIPNLHPSGPTFHWLDLAAMLALFGVLGLYGLWRFRGTESIAGTDPYTWQSLRYEGWP